MKQQKMPLSCLFKMALVMTALLSVSLQAGAAQDEQPWAVGEAYTADGERLLYREELQAGNPDLPHPTQVDYLTPAGERFAEKSVDYGISLPAPEIDFRDHRRGTRIQTVWTGEGENRILSLTYRADSGSEPRRGQFEPDELIVDAGFDPYIHRHWDRLTAGDRLVANFLVPSRLDTLKVGISETERRHCPTKVENIRCFEVSAAGLLRLVGWLVDPIYLGYQQTPRRLVLYQGRGNIPDEEGNSRQVRIHYHYPE